MYAVILGVLFLAMKWAEVGPVATWSWWIVLSPFAVAVVWWTWADKTGYNKRREIEKMEAKKDARRSKNMVALGLETRNGKKRR
jgi:small Trp-rich protein